MKPISQMTYAELTNELSQIRHRANLLSTQIKKIDEALGRKTDKQNGNYTKEL